MTACAFEKKWRYFAQFIVISFALLALITKRHSENPRREFSIWFLDISKQAAGYFIGFGFDTLFFSFISRGFIDDDECEEFFMNYLYDTVLGVMFNITVVYCLKIFVRKYFFSQRYKDLIKFGYYGEPFSWITYLMQLSIWTIIAMCGKLVIALLFLITTPALGPIFRAIFSVFSKNSQFKLVSITFILPVLLTSAAVWLQDAFLKYDRAEEESLKYLVSSCFTFLLCASAICYCFGSHIFYFVVHIHTFLTV
jgi:hypothetical protein